MNNYGGTVQGGVDEYAMPLTNASTPSVSMTGTAFVYPYFLAFAPASFFVTP